MPFTAPLLDDFHWTPTGSLGDPAIGGVHGWATGIGCFFNPYNPGDPVPLGHGIIQGDGNDANRGGGYATFEAAWGDPTFYNFEAYVDITGAGGQREYGIHGRMQNINISSYQSYTCCWFGGSFGTNGNFAIIKILSHQWATGGSPSIQFGSVNPTSFGYSQDAPRVGDKIGLRVYDIPMGVRIEGWLSIQGGPWFRAVAATDSEGPIRSTGYIGLHLGTPSDAGGLDSRMGNFWGGPITEVPAIDNVDFPTHAAKVALTGAFPDPLSEEFEARVNGLPPSTPPFISARKDPLSDPVEKSNTYGADPRDRPEMTGGDIKVM